MVPEHKKRAIVVWVLLLLGIVACKTTCYSGGCLVLLRTHILRFANSLSGRNPRDEHNTRFALE